METEIYQKYAKKSTQPETVHLPRLQIGKLTSPKTTQQNQLDPTL